MVESKKVVVPTNKVLVGRERAEVETKGELSTVLRGSSLWQSESSIEELGGEVKLKQEMFSATILSTSVPRGISSKVLGGSESRGPVEVGAGVISPIERITNWGLIVVNIT